MKKSTCFFLLHPVPIYEQDHGKRPRNSYQSLFELKNTFRKIPFLVRPFESRICGKKGKNNKTFNISRTKRAFYRK